MAEALSLEEEYYILDVVDECDPESLSNVFVDYTPRFDLEACLNDHLELYMTFLKLCDPVGVDLLLMHHYCNKTIKECAVVLGIPTAKARKLMLDTEIRLARMLLVLHVPVMKAVPLGYREVTITEPGLPLEKKRVS